MTVKFVKIRQAGVALRQRARRDARAAAGVRDDRPTGRLEAPAALARLPLPIHIRPHPRYSAPMCNDYRRTPPMETIREQWSQTRIPLVFPEGVPNLAPLESIRITDTGTIIRLAQPRRSEAGAVAPPEQRRESAQAGRPGPHESSTFVGTRSAPQAAGPTGSGRPDPFEAELVNRRWSWPGPSGKPVYNYRSDGRDIRQGRCLIVADGFYEFTTPPPPPEGGPKPKRKDKWLFTKPDEDWFCIAGLWRSTADVGEAWTMLTCEPGPDVAPYHHRQIVVLDRSDWGRWLDPSVPAQEICRPLPAGSLHVEKVGA